MNRLYDLVAKSELKDKVKIIGVGESDNAQSLQQFKAAYKVPFPLVPDPDWAIGVDVFHIGGTPTTLLLDKGGKVLLKDEGVFASAEAMFAKIKAKVK